MSKYIALSSVTHDGTYFKPTNELFEYATRSTLPVYATEISKLAVQYPLVFVKEGDQFGLHLLCSLSEEGANAYITPDGKWNGNYVPAIIRQHPFKAFRNKEGQRVLCIDEENAILGTKGSALFDEDKPSEFLRTVMRLVNEVFNARIATKKIIHLLQEYELIIPYEILIKKSEDSESLLKGIYRIDEVKLNQLEDEQWLALKEARALPLIYGQLFSIGNINKMVELFKIGINNTDPSTDIVENLDAFFDEADEGTLNFDGF